MRAPLQTQPGAGAAAPSAQSVEAAPGAGGWRPALAVAEVPCWREFALVQSLPPPMVSQPEAGTVVTATWSAPAMRSSAQVWPPGVRQGRKACSMLEGLWSGRFAVAASSWWSWAPCLGPSSGLFLPWPWRTPRLPRRSRPRGRARGAALAAHPPSSQPTASQTAGGGDRADGDGSTNSQRTEPADRPNNGHGNAGNDGQGRQDKPSNAKPGKAKPGKGEHGKGKDK